MNAPVRTLNFHGIGTPGDKIDASERPYWISTDFFRELASFLASDAARHILITFDDGNLSDLEIAAPILAERGLNARFFVLTGRLDMPGYLGPQDMQDLMKMGFAVGSHGIDHVNWAELSGDDLTRETAQSRARLQDLTGADIAEAAIPFGSYNKAVLNAIKSAGYSAAWTSDGGNTNPTAFLRPRLSVRRDMDLDTVRAALLGPIPAMRRLRRTLAMARKRLM